MEIIANPNQLGAKIAIPQHPCDKSLKGRFPLPRLTSRYRLLSKLKAVNGGVAATEASADPNRRCVAGAGGNRLLQLSRDVDEWPCTLRYPRVDDKTLEAPATQPTGPHHLEPHEEARRRLAVKPPRNLHPLPSERFAVKYARWEPSARMRLARIVRGTLKPAPDRNQHVVYFIPFKDKQYGFAAKFARVGDSRKGNRKTWKMAISTIDSECVCCD